MIQFTTNWVSRNHATWKKILAPYVGLPSVKALEIGVFEGRSSIWFLTHILTHPTASIICIDPYCKPIFYENIKPFLSRVQYIKGYSQIALRSSAFIPESFDFIYIDGDHKARATLENAVLCFRLLKLGGILIFDDYLWKCKTSDDQLLNPMIAIDVFLNVYEGQFDVLHKDWQVIIQRRYNTKL